MKKIPDKKIYIGKETFTIKFIPVKRKGRDDPKGMFLKWFGLKKINDK